MDLSITLGMFTDLMIATDDKPRALETSGEAISVLAPTFMATPHAVEQWMAMRLQRYQAASGGGTKPLARQGCPWLAFGPIPAFVYV